MDAQGDDETHYLLPVEETIATSLSPAAHMLQKFDGEWEGEIDRVFAHYAY